MTEAVIDWFFQLNLRDVGLALGILIVFIVLSKPVATLSLKILTKITTRTKTDWDDKTLEAFDRPLSIALMMLGLYLALSYLPFPHEINEFMTHLFRSIFIALLGWGLYNLADKSVHDVFYRARTKFNFKFDQIVVPFLTKVFKLLIFILIITVIFYEWGYPISGFVAGMGLGGLALALAARETLSNLFGGIVIITETPFTIGDWIETPSVEGIVEDINFRSTKVRTFEDSLVTVPNSTLANEPITNWSRMGKRQIFFHLHLHYETYREQIMRCVNDIREYIHARDDIDKEQINVNFYEFGESSFELMVYFFTKSTDWDQWLATKEEVNVKVLEILDEYNVRLALPSQDIYYQRREKEELSEDEREQLRSRQYAEVASGRSDEFKGEPDHRMHPREKGKTEPDHRMHPGDGGDH